MVLFTCGQVFVAYGWSLVAYGRLGWSFLLTVEAYGGRLVGSLLLVVPPVRKLDLVLFAHGSGTQCQMMEASFVPHFVEGAPR